MTEKNSAEKRKFIASLTNIFLSFTLLFVGINIALLLMAHFDISPDHYDRQFDRLKKEVELSTGLYSGLKLYQICQPLAAQLNHTMVTQAQKTRAFNRELGCGSFALETYQALDVAWLYFDLDKATRKKIDAINNRNMIGELSSTAQAQITDVQSVLDAQVTALKTSLGVN